MVSANTRIRALVLARREERGHAAPVPAHDVEGGREGAGFQAGRLAARLVQMAPAAVDPRLHRRHWCRVS
eukprot:3275567-Rhodomonas_salina.3